MKFHKDHWIYLAPVLMVVVGAFLLFSKKESKDATRQLASIEKEAKLKPNKKRKVIPKKRKKNLVKKAQARSIKTLPDHDLNKNWDQQFQALKNIEDCYNEEGLCGFPTTDPKAEHFAIGDRIKNDLMKMQNYILDNNIKDEQVSEVARHFLKVPDGHVKKAAMHLMASQDKNGDNLESLLSEVIAYHDAYLIEQGMLELSRYLGDETSERKIHQALNQAMATGSPFVAEQISKNLNPFINSSSFSLYSQTMKTLSKGSMTHKNLKNAINEYQRLLQAA